MNNITTKASPQTTQQEKTHDEVLWTCCLAAAPPWLHVALDLVQVNASLLGLELSLGLVHPVWMGQE